MTTMAVALDRNLFLAYYSLLASKSHLYIHGLFYLNQSRRLKTSKKEKHSMGKSKSILTMQTSIKHIQLSYSYKNYKAVCRASSSRRNTLYLMTFFSNK